MKKHTVFLVITAVLLCFVLSSCGTDGNNPSDAFTEPSGNTTENFFEDDTRIDIPDTTEEGGTFMEELSEDISEGLSDSSFLDPENGIVSDTAQAMD